MLFVCTCVDWIQNKSQILTGLLSIGVRCEGFSFKISAHFEYAHHKDENFQMFFLFTNIRTYNLLLHNTNNISR
jgi:hypothetical protein